MNKSIFINIDSLLNFMKGKQFKTIGKWFTIGCQFLKPRTVIEAVQNFISMTYYTLLSSIPCEWYTGDISTQDITLTY